MTTGQGLLGNNMFAYCGNNPVNNIDPLGTCYYNAKGQWCHDNWEYLGGYVRKPDPGYYAGTTKSGKNIYIAPDTNYSTLVDDVKVVDMRDNAIAATWGTIIIVILGIELIAWIISPILILFKNRIASSIGIIGIIALNLSDAICCMLSYMSMESPIKIANLIFTALMILASSLLLWRVSRQAGKTGEGSAVSSDNNY